MVKKVYDENEWGKNVRMIQRRQQEQAAHKRVAVIGAAVAVSPITTGGVMGLHSHGKNSSGAESMTIMEITTKRIEMK